MVRVLGRNLLTRVCFLSFGVSVVVVGGGGRVFCCCSLLERGWVL